jgi:cellulose 1,4-beta-cellobiosidase
MQLNNLKHPLFEKIEVSIILRIIASLFGVLIFAQATNAALLTKCERYASVNVIKNRAYSVHNNIWNGDRKSQCIQVNDANGDFIVTTSKNNKSTNGPPASYAFIHKGCHWGQCTNTEGNMPILVGNIREAQSNWDTSQTADGIYNAAYDLWFHTNHLAIGQLDSTEIMIWLAYTGEIRPVGSLQERAVLINDAMWDVWTGWNGQNSVITYVRATSIDSVRNFNLKAFIADGASKGFIQNNWYLISIAAGFEIWQGGKGLSSSAFSLLLE